MPIYKMKGSKDGRQKYRVRVNYIDSLGKTDRLTVWHTEVQKQRI